MLFIFYSRLIIVYVDDNKHIHVIVMNTD